MIKTIGLYVIPLQNLGIAYALSSYSGFRNVAESSLLFKGIMMVAVGGGGGG